MEILLGLLILLAYHLIFVGIGYALGKRSTWRQVASQRLLNPPPSRAETMLREIDSIAFASIVGADLQQRLREHYAGQVPVFRQHEPPTPTTETEPEPVTFEPEFPPVAPVTHRAPGPAVQVPKIAVPRRRVPREPVRLDPALVFLYLGAFLIIAAGLIYASFNWEELEGGQKLALLAAATAGFIAAGLALLGNTRLRPAAETFIGIGALLIPSNIIAAMTILSDTPMRATAALQIGAMLATLLYAVFSYRPGTAVYRYAVMISASITIGVVPASLGGHHGWALPVLALAPALVIAAVDWLGDRADRFRRPALTIAPAIPAVAFLTIPLVGLPATQEPIVIASILAGTAITLATVAIRRDEQTIGAIALAALLAAVVVANTWIEPATLRITLAMMAGFGLLWASLRGPRIFRIALSDITAIAAALGFAATAPAALPIGDMDDALTWPLALAPSLIAAGWATVAVMRRWPAIMTPVMVLAFASHVLVLDRAGVVDVDASAFLLRVLPGTVIAAAMVTWVHRWSPLPDCRRHAVFLWLGFGALTLPLGFFAFAEAELEGWPSRLTALTFFTVFAVAAIVASQQQHRVQTMAIAGMWVVAAVATLLEPIRVTLEQALQYPLYAVTLAALALLVPLAEEHTWWRRQRILRWPTGVIGGAAALSAAPMAEGVARFLTEPDTLDTLTWWPTYVTILAVTALVFGLYARYRYPTLMTGVAGIGAVLAGAMLLRAGMLRFEPDPLVWTAVGITLALGLLLAGDRLDRGPSTIAHHWARWATGFGSVLMVIAAGRGLMETGRYLASGWTEATALHVEAATWWLPLLGGWFAIAGVAHWLGVRRDQPFLSIGVAVPGLIAIALTTRMVTIDLFAWSLIGMAIGAAALAAWAILRRSNPASQYIAGWQPVTLAMQGIGVAALVANIAAGIEGDIDPWRNAALYGVLTVAAAVLSVRLRVPEGLYASTSSLGLTVLFVLLSPQVDPMDGLLILAALAWVLIVGSLAPRLSRRWVAPLECSGYAFGAVPIVYPPVRTELAWSIDSAVYGRVTLAILSLGLVIGLTALVRRSPVRASVAIPLVMAAALRQVATYEPESWQPYAAVLAIGLAVTGLAWHRTHRVSDPLYALAGAVLIAVPFFESFTIGDTTDAFVAGGYGILVVVIGLILRRQEPVAIGVIGVTLVVMRQMVDTAMAFESWQVLGTAGAVLLIGGTVILMIRDTLRHWVESGLHHWHSLG